MHQLALHYNPILKGSFQLKQLNFLFVFQVNCPGCFLYGIPIVNELYEEFNNQVSFIGLSTAFENFDLNTEHNTIQLIKKNILVGHTKKAFQEHGYEAYPYAIKFPVAMDRFLSDEQDITKAIEHICSINPNYESFSNAEQTLFKQHVKSHLNTLDNVAMTFTLNQLKGTPSMIIFDDNYKILYHKFGHTHIQNIRSQLSSFIKTVS